jgi:hypothetical protein
MEMEQHEVKVATRRRCIVLDRATILETNIKIPDPKRIIWTHTKHNYINMWSKWRTRRILLRKKTKLLK